MKNIKLILVCGLLLSCGFVISTQKEKQSLTAEQNKLLVELIRNALITPVENSENFKISLLANFDAAENKDAQKSALLVKNIVEEMQPFFLCQNDELLLIKQSISENSSIEKIDQVVNKMQDIIQTKTETDKDYYGSRKSIQDQLLLAQLFSLKLHRLVDSIDKSTSVEQVNYVLEQFHKVIQYKRSHDVLYEESQDLQADGHMLGKILLYHAMHDIKPSRWWY